MATQKIPPVAQFTLPSQDTGSAPTADTSAPSGVPPVTQFSLPDSQNTTAAQTQDHPILNAVKGAADFVVKPAESLGVRGAQLLAGGTANVAQALGQQGEADKIRANLQKPVTTVTGSQVDPLKPGLGGAEQIAGDSLQTGLLAAAPGVGVGRGIAARIGENALVGAGFGAGNALSSGGNAGDVAKQAGIGGVLGGALGGVTGKLTGAAQDLKNSATEDINKVLSPTTKVNKQITQDIAPSLAQKGVISSTREGLLAKYQAFKDAAGENLDKAYADLPEKAQFEVGNLFNAIQKQIDRVTVNGVVPSAAQAKVDSLTNVMKDLANIGVETSPDGTQVFADVANVRKLRQIMDLGQKDFSYNSLDTAAKAARKTLANNIRSEFATQYPNISQFNKDFNFWSDATKVLEDAIERKTGQTGLIRRAAGAGVGAAIGGHAGHPAIAAGLGDLLTSFISSPAYHTTAAAIKSKIANAIEKADYPTVTALIDAAIAGGKSGALETVPGMINNATR